MKTTSSTREGYTQINHAIQRVFASSLVSFTDDMNGIRYNFQFNDDKGLKEI
jgi:hypothetical protein